MRRQQTSVAKFINPDATDMFRAEQANVRSEAPRLQAMGMRRISGPIGSRIARLAEAGVYITHLLGTWTMGCFGFI